MNYHAQLLAAGVSEAEARASYAMNEILRIENFERYSQQQVPPDDYDDELRRGYEMKYGA